MTDGPMYWSSNEQAGWYQTQSTADPTIASHQQQNAYQSPSNYHQMHGSGPQTQQGPAQTMPPEHPSPSPQTMMNAPTSNGRHHMQSNMPQQASHSNQPPVNTYNQHHMQNVNNVMHDSTNQQQQSMTPQQPSLVQSQSQIQNLDSSSNYSYPQQLSQAQMFPHQASASPNGGYHTSQPDQISHNNALNHGPSPVSTMHTQSAVHQQHQPMYPPEQYSPAPYWNSAHPPPLPPQQSSYGPSPSGPASGPSLPPTPQQSSPMLHHQGAMSTPPSIDGSPAYQMSNSSMPVPAPQSHQPPPNNSNMPYESRNTGYGSPYAPQTSGYYGSHEQSTNAYESQNHMIASQQHQQQPISQNHQAQSNWSNGYYQPNASSYPNGPNHYSQLPPTYNGPPNHAANRHQTQHHGMMQNGGPPPNHHQQQVHQQHTPQTPYHQSGPMHPPQHHYVGMQQSQHIHPSHATPHPQHQQRWPAPDQMPLSHAMPMPDRTKKGLGEKKPVKPRAPRQRNPNGTGRRRDPVNTKEHKKSGYAQFFKLKLKELEQDNKFGDSSRTIADLWQRLSDEERASYSTEVNNKRKEMLKKKASQQAQDLVQGIKQE